LDNAKIHHSLSRSQIERRNLALDVMEEPRLLIKLKDASEIQGACSLCDRSFHGFIRTNEDEAMQQLNRNFRLHCRQRHGLPFLAASSRGNIDATEALSETRPQDQPAVERIVEDVPIPAYVCARSTRKLLAANPEFYRLMGYTSSESKQLRLEDLRPPEDIPLLVESLSHNLAEGTIERRYQTKDGRLLRVRLQYRNVSVVEQDTTVPDAFLVLLTDFKIAS
jgi:PAS domain S-box-containing protein